MNNLIEVKELDRNKLEISVKEYAASLHNIF